MSTPPRLRIDGALPPGPGVAIVGSRNATVEGLRFARTLARDVAEHGILVWSGGALGIDTEAHEGALEAQGTTVVVLGSGLDSPSPKANIELFERTLRGGGAIVSMCNDEKSPIYGSFLARNGLLAAATFATIVIEARPEGGAMKAAACARGFARPVGAVPQAPWVAASSGALTLFRLGARPVSGLDDVLDLLRSSGLGGTAHRPIETFASGMSRRDGAKQLALDDALSAERNRRLDEAIQQLTPAEHGVMTSLAAGATHIDAVCERMGASVAEIVPAVVGLRLRGLVIDGVAGLRLATHVAPRFIVPPP